MSFGGIEVIARLSTGGMGEVLLGRRKGALGFEKLLAIKTIRGDLIERADFRAMFLDEARLVARLDHPTITQVYDFGEEGKLLYITMEYVAGVPLSQLLRAGRAPLPPAVCARLVAETCRGLHHAHEATDMSGEPLHVVHRDVSPQNLLMTFDGRMKILDFGIALTKGREAPDTQVGVLKGKPSYMAPEHLRGGAVDRRADIFSCAVVLHEILTGRKLFTRETALATALAVEGDPIDPPSRYVDGLPRDLDAIVLRGLARNPADRFQDAKQLAEALEHVALEIDPMSVQQYAELELGEQRILHQAWLNGVLDQAENRAATGAPSFEVQSLIAGPGPTDSLPGPPPEARPSNPPGPAEFRPSLPPSPAPSPITPPRAAGPDAITYHAANRRQTKAPLYVLLGAIGVGLVGVGFFIESSTSSDAASRGEVFAQPLPYVDLETSAATVASALADVVEDVLEPATTSVAIAEDDSEGRRSYRSHRSRRRSQKAHREEREREKAEAKQEAEEPVAFGYLTVGAEPYALVRLDGLDFGVTPIVRKKLPAGKHEVQLVSPDTGEVRVRKKIKLGPEEHERITWP
jgi:serine/threonine protein kinase